MRCLDENGKLRIFPVNMTNLHVPADIIQLKNGGYIVSIDDLMSLKKLVDAIF